MRKKTRSLGNTFISLFPNLPIWTHKNEKMSENGTGKMLFVFGPVLLTHAHADMNYDIR